MAVNIITNIANADNAKKFLGDLLFDAENSGNLETTVDGLMMLFGLFANKQNSGAADLADELQIYLYGWTSHYTDSYLNYLSLVKAGKDYQNLNQK